MTAAAHLRFEPRTCSAGRRTRSARAAHLSTPSKAAAIRTRRRVRGLRSRHVLVMHPRCPSGSPEATVRCRGTGGSRFRSVAGQVRRATAALRPAREPALPFCVEPLVGWRHPSTFPRKRLGLGRGTDRGTGLSKASVDHGHPERDMINGVYWPQAVGELLSEARDSGLPGATASVARPESSVDHGPLERDMINGSFRPGPWQGSTDGPGSTVGPTAAGRRSPCGLSRPHTGKCRSSSHSWLPAAFTPGGLHRDQHPAHRPILAQRPASTGPLTATRIDPAPDDRTSTGALLRRRGPTINASTARELPALTGAEPAERR
ncbi:MAG: hypothetical protein JWL64_816 [Frankiales bacterium]|nr:hypothetical protein [Frankiales bacterium]